MPTTTGTTSSTSGASIVQTLGVGSGVDTTALVASLVDAQYGPKTSQLKSKEDALTAQISAVGSLQSGITGFASALNTLTKSGSLLSQPTSSNSAVLTASALSGAKLSGLSASVEVTRLATAQSATTATSFASRTAALSTGTLTLTLGTATVDKGTMTDFLAGSAAPISIAIDSDHATLDGVAKAINAAKAGVTATVITDADGTARLSLKGATGSASAFTLSGDTPELAQLNVGVNTPSTTLGSAAGNAALKLDGVAVERASNTVTDLIDGVKLNLQSASIGNPVTIGSNPPTSGLSQAVNDFVDTFNQLRTSIATQTDPKTGPLKSDTAAAVLSRSLRNLTLTPLVRNGAAGTPTTLAEIGVSTNRDGSLSVNATQLASALAKWPDVVEAMFADGSLSSGDGLNAALGAISSNATSKLYGLGASTSRYTKARTDVTDAETKLSDASAATKTRMTQQFAAMDSKVAAYKSTQAFMTAQINAWFNSKN